MYYSDETCKIIYYQKTYNARIKSIGVEQIGDDMLSLCYMWYIFQSNSNAYSKKV